MDLQTWFASIPKVTKFYLCSSFAMTFATNYKMINPMNFILDWESVLSNFQIWRLFTNFFIHGKFSFQFMMFMMMIYNSLQKVEKAAIENKRFAEFIMMIVYLISFILFITFFLDQSPVLCFEFLFALIYIECKRDPEQPASIWGLFVVKNAYVPWVLLFISMIVGGNLVSDLVGIASGHIYFFLKDIAPITYNWDLLKTPKFLVNKFDKKPPTNVNFTTLNNNNNYTGATGNSSGFRMENNANTNRFNAFSGRGATWG